MSNWRLLNNRIIFTHKNKDFFWEMPNDYEMPSKALLSLVEYLLLTPFGVHVEVLEKKVSRVHRTALAYSGGVDSAAAFELIDQPFPIYTQVASPSKLHKQENALLALRNIGGLSVLTNQDELPQLYGKNKGFYGAAGWTLPSVLLSEHYGFDTFADGNILEFVYLRSKFGHGTMYVEPDYSKIHDAFARLNYFYCMPCAGLTEVSTTLIASGFKYVMGCMRGESGKPCLKCMKCYRKMAIQGACIPSNSEVEKNLNKEWIPVLATLLWARDNKGLQHPILENLDKNYSWVEGWYEKSIEFIPSHLRSLFLLRLKEYSIEKVDDVSSLLSWSSKVSNNK